MLRRSAEEDVQIRWDREIIMKWREAIKTIISLAILVAGVSLLISADDSIDTRRSLVEGRLRQGLKLSGGEGGVFLINDTEHEIFVSAIVINNSYRWRCRGEQTATGLLGAEFHYCGAVPPSGLGAAAPFEQFEDGDGRRFLLSTHRLIEIRVSVFVLDEDLGRVAGRTPLANANSKNGLVSAVLILRPRENPQR